MPILTPSTRRTLLYGAVTEAPAFSPTDISGLQLWLDFSDITTLYTDSGKTTPVTADGDVIGAAVDKSGSGNDATQGTTGNKPTYKTGIQNSLSVGRSDGSDDYLAIKGNIAPSITVNTVTVLGVWKYTVAAATSVIGDDDDVRLEASSTSTMMIRFSGGSNLTQSVSNNPLAGFYVWGQTWAGTNNATIIYQNGTQQDSDSYGGAANADYSIIFSRRFDAYFFAGDIGELLIYNSVLSGDDFSAAVSYLNTKWAVY